MRLAISSHFLEKNADKEVFQLPLLGLYEAPIRHATQSKLSTLTTPNKVLTFIYSTYNLNLKIKLLT